MAPEDESKRKNPLPITNESVLKGQALFTELCASCHGVKASGISNTKTGLSVDTPNLPNSLKMHTDGDFHWKILNGKDDMPSFKEELSENETWDIVNYIRSLIMK
jgi:mono/diheme cytochrome c family protein